MKIKNALACSRYAGNNYLCQCHRSWATCATVYLTDIAARPTNGIKGVVQKIYHGFIATDIDELEKKATQFLAKVRVAYETILRVIVYYRTVTYWLYGSDAKAARCFGTAANGLDTGSYGIWI